MTNHRGHELKHLKVTTPRAPRDGRAEPLPDEVGTYRVIGRREVLGVKRGHLVDLPEAQALRLMKAGAIELNVVEVEDEVDPPVDDADSLSSTDLSGTGAGTESPLPVSDVSGDGEEV